MVELSQNDLKVIEDFPLRDGFDAFRSNFTSTHFKDRDVDIVQVIDDLTSNASESYFLVVMKVC